MRHVDLLLTLARIGLIVPTASNAYGKIYESPHPLWLGAVRTARRATFEAVDGWMRRPAPAALDLRRDGRSHCSTAPGEGSDVLWLLGGLPMVIRRRRRGGRGETMLR